MSLVAAIRGMLAQGFTVEQALTAAEVIENTEISKLEARRANDRARKQAQRSRDRASDASRDDDNGHVTSRVSQPSRDRAFHEAKSKAYESAPRARVEDNLLLIELTEKDKGKNNITPREVLLDGLRPEVADAVLAHRRAKKCPLTTPHAARLLLKSFNSTADPNAAAETMIARGWQGFNAEWLNNTGGKGNGRGQKGDLIEAGLELVEKRRREAMQPDSRSGNVDAVVRLLSER